MDLSNRPYISFEKAKELSIIKWQMLSISCDYSAVKEHPDLERLISNCGFCERWKQGLDPFDVLCGSCEFGNVAGSCLNPDSMFGRYRQEVFKERVYCGSPSISKDIYDSRKVKERAKEILHILESM